MDIENYLLTKNDFELCTTGAFKKLLNESEFVDVTLACPDGKQVDAHKVILSACSPFFREILHKNRKKYQLIYLKGIIYKDLASILQFMYTGETKVCRENLDGFLLAAQELQVEGLVYSQANNYKDIAKKDLADGNVKEMKRNEFDLPDENMKLPPLKKEQETPKKAYKSDFKCEECQLYLQNQINFDFHNEMLHKKCVESEEPEEPFDDSLIKSDDTDGNNAQESGNYTCETDGCVFSTTSRDELKGHILSLHLGLKKYSPLSIPEATKETKEGISSPDSLTGNTDLSYKQKRDRPDLERKFFCKICDFGTAHKFNLKRHMTNVHGIASVDSSVSDIYADEDGEEVSLKENNKKKSSKKKRGLDLENVDPSQILYCDRCDFTTTHIKSKRRHIMTIHEGLRHPCNYCNFQATQPYELKMMKNHPEKLYQYIGSFGILMRVFIFSPSSNQVHFKSL